MEWHNAEEKKERDTPTVSLVRRNFRGHNAKGWIKMSFWFLLQASDQVLLYCCILRNKAISDVTSRVSLSKPIKEQYCEVKQCFVYFSQLNDPQCRKQKSERQLLCLLERCWESVKMHVFSWQRVNSFCLSLSFFFNLVFNWEICNKSKCQLIEFQIYVKK